MKFGINKYAVSSIVSNELAKLLLFFIYICKGLKHCIYLNI